MTNKVWIHAALWMVILEYPAFLSAMTSKTNAPGFQRKRGVMDEFDPRSFLIRSLRNAHNARERTQQVELGPSSIGDCRRRVWHLLQGTPETNPDTDILATTLGTFIHEGIARVLADEDSPFEESKLFELERETHFKDMPGHINFFHKGFLTVVDWKTSTKKNLKNFPSQQNIWQIQNYGLMKTCEGVQVKKVALVIIPRDGRPFTIHH